MRVLITGATGFLGGALARRLRAHQHDVHALVRSPARAGALEHAGITLHAGDITDKASMRTPMRDADAVCHVAGWYKTGVRAREEARATNVTGTRNVLELMQELGIPRGVYTSTLAVNSDTHGELVDESYRFTGTHLSLYDETKAEAHRIAEAFIDAGLPLVIVQPGLVYGPGDTSMAGQTLRDYLQRKLPAVPKGVAYCWAHVDDIAEGHHVALERGQPGRAYFLAGPAHTLRGALTIAEDISGVPAPRFDAPSALFRVAASLMRPIEAIVPLPPMLSAETLRLLAGVTYLGRSDRASSELGWRPRSLQEGLAETLDHEMRNLRMVVRPRA